jgi:hypothetical protein
MGELDTSLQHLSGMRMFLSSPILGKSLIQRWSEGKANVVKTVAMDHYYALLGIQ